MASSDVVAELWEGSAVRRHCGHELELFESAALEGQLVAIVADENGHTLWSCGPTRLRSWAERVHFVDGGCWDERSMGVNAVSRALVSGRPATVRTVEHTMACLESWACHAAPVIDLIDGRTLGVLDVSMSASRRVPLASALVQSVARAMTLRLDGMPPTDELVLKLLGQPAVHFRGERLKLSLRQLEILALLALHPNGIEGARLHDALLGDGRRVTSTLKVEISALRKHLDGQIDSRPYRLTLPVRADFLDCRRQLQLDNPERAIRQWPGSFLPASDAPELVRWRYALDAAMTRAIDGREQLSPFDV